MSHLGSSSSSSSQPKQNTYDVFLTFRTKCNSIIALQSSLINAAIKTFVDDPEETTPSLLQVIERSRIAIVVFTDEFVGSKRCLKKFEKILECKISDDDQVILPVFCGVNTRPKVKRSYRFEQLSKRLIAGIYNKELRKRWERAVAGVILQSTWEVSYSNTRDSEEIKDIIHFIKKILHGSLRLFIENLDDANSVLQHYDYPVGLQLRIKEILDFLKYSLEEENANIVVIWGIGGIGKTTIAETIYNTFYCHFKRASFLANIKNVWEQDNGKIHLQRQLISDVSYTKSVEMHDNEMGISQLKTTLGHKKALVILDDVSQIDQLMALCGSGEWFGAGSLIFITTRNKHLFDHLKVNYVYEMKKMDKSESLELFSCHAFEQPSPTNDFMDLSKEAITFCEGLPLVLEVIGSLLHNRPKSVWRSVLKKLKGIPSGQTQEKLKISYNFLADSEKDLFINIACFYVGRSKTDITQILNGSKLPIESAIDVLIKRNLVKITGRNCKFYVHDLLQDIARGINLNNPKPKYIYDVFLSFRGEDTRKSFATHLYTALKHVGIEVFMDKGIKRGENIPSSLLQAIEGSRISIIIFSTNYAGSRWCLEELEKIMDYHKTIGQEVLPIFYGVQPSEVRKQVNIVGNALEGLIKRFSASKEKKTSWKRALTEVANLSGWNLHDYTTETELIDNILETLTKKLDDNTYLFVAHHPVGLRSRVQDIIQQLSSKSNEVIIAGIWGMGGIGKTTIAKAIYNEIGRNYECKSFLANIRGVWEQDNGQVHLQEQLLSGILKMTRVTLPSIELGKTIMKERLCHKKALIALDDVNNVDQLNALCGSREWFGQGSRIIVTTRDEHLLKILQPVHVYNVKEMDINESLELFSWHAFKQAIPKTDFFELSRRVVSYSGGLPLALEILGSYLFDRTIPAWESVLEKLQGIPNDQIHEKLRISYDGLGDHTEKEIFLDICCFFIGKDRNYVTQILNGCELHAEIGITRLIELSLIKVDKNNKLGMHDLLRDMGREIIREKSPEEPEMRTRLLFQEEVLHVLRNNTGTIAVKGLALNLSRKNTIPLSTKAFKKMKRLRLLQLDRAKLVGDYEYLSKELRWLCWHGFSLENIPVDFSQENIVALDLRYSNLRQVWKKSQFLERLKILNLSHSHQLTRTPDFSKLPNLEKLKLKDCPRLSEVNPTIGDLKYISLLNFKDCKDLNHFPRSIYKLKSLKTLNLSGCSKIEKLEEDIEQMGSLTTLLANQTAITQVPFSLVRSKSIKYVSLCGYEGFSRDVFPSLIWSQMSPANNPRSFTQAFWYMPHLLHNLSHSLFAKRTAVLGKRPSRSLVPYRKSPASIGFHEQVHKEVSKNFMSSVTIHAGESNKVIDALLKRISQGWSEKGFGDYSLPGDNYPDWLNFKGEGFSVLFKVPQVTGRSLKGMILCIVYFSPQDNMASVYPVSVLIKDYTKPNIEFYKRDATTTSDDEKWRKIITDLVPGNEVEVKVDFARQLCVKETVIYFVYGEDVDTRKCIDY